MKFYNKFIHFRNFNFYLRISTEVLIIMSSPGQKKGTCGHIIAVFDGHLKYARCREKGDGDDPCVPKHDCSICKAFTPEQIFQLATPTYRERKNKEKKVSASPTPTLVDLSQVSVLGRVDREKTIKKSETPSGKKKHIDKSPKPSSKRKSSSKPRSNEPRDLDEKWSECFSRLEAMLLSKVFAVPVEPVRKPPSVVTSDQPFFDPGTSTSCLSSGVTVGGAGSSLVQTTGDPAVLTATQPVEAPSTRGAVTASKSATSPVEGSGTSGVIQQNATQPVEAPSAGMATQPVEAPGAVPEVLLTGTGSAALHAEITGSDSEEELRSKVGSPVDGNVQDGSPELTRDESADQEVSEESTYRETIRGVRSFMGWHQIPEFNGVSSADDNPFAGSQVQPTGKVSVKLPVDDWLCRKMEKLNLTVAEGYPSRSTETAGLLRDQFVKTPRLTRRTLVDLLFVHGLWNRQNSTMHSVGLPSITHLLSHPPGPLARAS